MIIVKKNKQTKTLYFLTFFVTKMKVFFLEGGETGAFLLMLALFVKSSRFLVFPLFSFHS